MYEMNKKRQACLAAVATAACIGSPTWAQTPSAGEVKQVLPSLQVVRDSVTGRLRAPTHEEVAAMAAADSKAAAQRGTQTGGNAAMASVLGANHPLVRSGAANAAAPTARMGAIAKRTDIGKMHYSVATRDANGQLEVNCVAGESTEEHALHGNAGVAKGARHDY
jgi:hypothetical protein